MMTEIYHLFLNLLSFFQKMIKYKLHSLLAIFFLLMLLLKITSTLSFFPFFGLSSCLKFMTCFDLVIARFINEI